MVRSTCSLASGWKLMKVAPASAKSGTMRSTGLHHQVHVDRRLDAVLAQRLAHQRADGEVRHVVVVHHVEVDEVGAGGEHGSTSSPRRAKSAERIEGAIQGARHEASLPDRRWRAGQAGEGLAVLLAGARDHLGGQLRARRRLVPVERLQVVAHELLVVARRAGARRGRCRPARSARNPASAPRRSAYSWPSASMPNSNLVSAMMMPRSARVARPRSGRARARRRAPCSASSRADERRRLRRSEMFSSWSPTSALVGGREDRLRQLLRPGAGPAAARCRTAAPVSW